MVEHCIVETVDETENTFTMTLLHILVYGIMYTLVCSFIVTEQSIRGLKYSWILFHTKIPFPLRLSIYTCIGSIFACFLVCLYQSRSFLRAWATTLAAIDLISDYIPFVGRLRACFATCIARYNSWGSDFKIVNVYRSNCNITTSVQFVFKQTKPYLTFTDPVVLMYTYNTIPYCTLIPAQEQIQFPLYDYGTYSNPDKITNAFWIRKTTSSIVAATELPFESLRVLSVCMGPTVFTMDDEDVDGCNKYHQWTLFELTSTFHGGLFTPPFISEIAKNTTILDESIVRKVRRDMTENKFYILVINASNKVRLIG